MIAFMLSVPKEQSGIYNKFLDQAASPDRVLDGARGFTIRDSRTGPGF